MRQLSRLHDDGRDHGDETKTFLQFPLLVVRGGKIRRTCAWPTRRREARTCGDLQTGACGAIRARSGTGLWSGEGRLGGPAHGDCEIGQGCTKSSTQRARGPADGHLAAHSDTGDLRTETCRTCTGAHSGTRDLRTRTWDMCPNPPPPTSKGIFQRTSSLTEFPKLCSPTTPCSPELFGLFSFSRILEVNSLGTGT